MVRWLPGDDLLGHQAIGGVERRFLVAVAISSAAFFTVSDVDKSTDLLRFPYV